MQILVDRLQKYLGGYTLRYITGCLSSGYVDKTYYKIIFVLGILIFDIKNELPDIGISRFIIRIS